MLKILCYKNQGIHWYPCHPTFLWKINFRLVWRLISALIWDISGLWNCSHGRDFREKGLTFQDFWRRTFTENISNEPGSWDWIKPLNKIRHLCPSYCAKTTGLMTNDAASRSWAKRNFRGYYRIMETGKYGKQYSKLSPQHPTHAHQQWIAWVLKEKKVIWAHWTKI